MGRGPARIGIAVGIVGCLCSCLGQTSAPGAPQQSFPDSAAYSTFFYQVAQLARASGAVLLNGEPSALKQPTPQDEIGLTDREARLLNELATEYSAEGLAISSAQQRLRWERLMRTTGSEEVPASLSEQLEALNNRRSTMVLEYVRRLEAMFGEARSRTLNDWILSRAKAGTFFPSLFTAK